MTYAQAAELTWPQLMHAISIDSNIAAEPATAEEIQARQNEIFDRIVERRRCLAVDLLRMPLRDLVTQISAETAGGPVKIEPLLSGLRRYADTKS